MENHHQNEFWKVKCSKESLTVYNHETLRTHQRFGATTKGRQDEQDTRTQTCKEFWHAGLMGVHTAEPGRPRSPATRRRSYSATGRRRRLESPRRQGAPTWAAER